MRPDLEDEGKNSLRKIPLQNKSIVRNFLGFVPSSSFFHGEVLLIVGLIGSIFKTSVI